MLSVSQPRPPGIRRCVKHLLPLKHRPPRDTWQHRRLSREDTRGGKQTTTGLIKAVLVAMHCLKIPRKVNPRILQLLKNTRVGADSIALGRRRHQPAPYPCWGAAAPHIIHRALHSKEPDKDHTK